MKFPTNKLLIFFLLWMSIESIDSAKILAVFPSTASSHVFLNAKLMRELAKRGHEVTTIAPFPQKEKTENLTEIVVDTFSLAQRMMIEDSGIENVTYFQMRQISNLLSPRLPFQYTQLSMEIVEKTVEHPEVQKLLKNAKFDVVIADSFMTDAFIGLAHVFDCPYILVHTCAPTASIYDLVSNPVPHHYIPEIYFPFNIKMNFWEKLGNVYLSFAFKLFRHYYHLPTHNNVIQKYFKGAPSLEECIEKYFSLILVTSHPAITAAQPLVPSIVEIGGFHIEDPKPLPHDLQEFIDNADEGVILFSFGSLFKISEMPEEKLNAFLKAFSKLKQKVLMKWETDILPNKPSNVKHFKWLPQNDLLAHPNMRLFLTHAGHTSLTETLYHGVPILGTSIFFDQVFNIMRAVDNNFGVSLPYDDITEETLTKALNEILNNTIYSQNVKRLSKIFRDQPMHPLDTAIYWVEYIIRNKGADHLKTAARHLHWTQLYLWDVTGFTIGIVLLCFMFVYLRVRRVKKIHTEFREPKKTN